MGGWVDGKVDGWMDGWMDGRIDINKNHHKAILGTKFMKPLGP